MPCCTADIIQFVEEEITTIPGDFTGDLRPNVTVLYLVDGVYTAAGVFTNIRIEPTQVVVEHGGLMTGRIKIW